MHVYVITKYVNRDEMREQTLIGIAKTKRKAKQKIIDDVAKCFVGHAKAINWCQDVNGIAEIVIDIPIRITYTYTKIKI